VDVTKAEQVTGACAEHGEGPFRDAAGDRLLFVDPPSAGQPAWLAALQQTSLFGPAAEATHTRDLQLPAHTVMGVERTRATFLSYSQQDQASFTADLGKLLQPAAHIDLVQEAFLAMAPAAA
jgi:hypothetical protein